MQAGLESSLVRAPSEEIVFPLGSIDGSSMAFASADEAPETASIHSENVESGRADSPVSQALSADAEPHTLTSTTPAASASASMCSSELNASGSGSTLSHTMALSGASGVSEADQAGVTAAETSAAGGQASEELTPAPDTAAAVGEEASASVSASRARWQAPPSYGLLTAYELLRYLSTLVNPLQRHTSETHMQCALQLLTVALEAAGETLASHAPLRRVLQCELCKHLARLLQTDRIALFVATLRLIYLLVDSLRTHLKYQLRYLLVKMAEIITGTAVFLCLWALY